MSFPGFTNQFTTSPTSIAFPSYLALTLDTLTTQLYWPFQAPYQENQFSQVIQVTTNTSASNAIMLPNATATATGQSTIIVNSSGVDFYIVNNEGFTLGTATASDTISYYLSLTDNTTEAGQWMLLPFGTGTTPVIVTSLVDSTSQAGYNNTNFQGGLAAIVDPNASTYLKTSMYVNEWAGGDYDQDISDRATMLAWTGGTGTYTLMEAADAGEGFIFSINNLTLPSAGAAITMATQGSDTVDVPSINASNSASFVSDGVSKWISLGLGLNALPSTFTNVIVYAANGSISAPSLSFNTDNTLGFFYNIAGQSMKTVQNGQSLAEFRAVSSSSSTVSLGGTTTTAVLNLNGTAISVGSSATLTNQMFGTTITLGSTTAGVTTLYGTTVTLGSTTAGATTLYGTTLTLGSTAAATTTLYGTTLTLGSTTAGTTLLYGTTLTLGSTVAGTTTLYGTAVTLGSTAATSMTIHGQAVTIGNSTTTTSGALYGTTLTLGSSTTTTANLFGATVNIGSTIGTAVTIGASGAGTTNFQNNTLQQSGISIYSLMRAYS